MQTWEKNGTANVGMKQEKLVEQILELWSLEKVSAAQFHSALLPEASRRVLWSSMQPLYLFLSPVPGAVLCTTSSSGSTAGLCRVSLNSPGWLRKQGVITLSSPCISLHGGVKKTAHFCVQARQSTKLLCNHQYTLVCSSFCSFCSELWRT